MGLLFSLEMEKRQNSKKTRRGGEKKGEGRLKITTFFVVLFFLYVGARRCLICMNHKLHLKSICIEQNGFLCSFRIHEKRGGKQMTETRGGGG